MRYVSDTWRFMKTYIAQHYKAIIVSGVIIYPLLILLSAASSLFIHIETSDIDFTGKDIFTFIALGTVFTVNILILTVYHLRSAIGDRRVFTSMPLPMVSKLTGTFLLGLIWCVWNILIYLAFAFSYALIRFGHSDMDPGEVDLSFIWAILFGIFAYLAVMIFYKLMEGKGFYNFVLFMGIATAIVLIGSAYRALFSFVTGIQAATLGCVTWHFFTIAAVFAALSVVALRFNMYKEG